MIQQFSHYEGQGPDPHSDIASSQKSILEKQVLDSAISRKMLADFERLLKNQTTFFLKAKAANRPVY